MKRRIIGICLCLCMAIGLIPALSGCDSGNHFQAPDVYEDLPDTYVENTDYPIGFDGGASGPFVAPTENGYYFLGGWHLYYMDKDSLSPQILCNRPECTHKTADCNALFFYEQAPFIQYYEGHLYVSSFALDSKEKQYVVLYEVSPDTCTRRVVCKLPYGLGSGSWGYMMHRGYLYMYHTDAENMYLERTALNQLSDDAEPELLYKLETIPIEAPMIYGDHVILFDWIAAGDTYKGTLWDYNIKTATCDQIPTPDSEEIAYCIPDSFFDQNLLLKVVSQKDYKSAIAEDEKEITSQIEYLSYDYTTKTVSDFAVVPSEGSLYSNLKYDGVHWIDFFINNLDTNEATFKGQTVRLMNEDMTVEKSAAFAGAWTGLCAGDSEFSFIYYGRSATCKLDVVDKRNDSFEVKTVWERSEKDAKPGDSNGWPLPRI